MIFNQGGMWAEQKKNLWLCSLLSPISAFMSLFYLQFLLLFLTLHLALRQSLRRLLFEQLSTLGFESVQLGLTGQFCYAAVGAQLELTEPAQTETCKHITACGCQCWGEKGGNPLFWCKQIMWICLKIKQPQISQRVTSGWAQACLQVSRKCLDTFLPIVQEWHSSESFGLPCMFMIFYDIQRVLRNLTQQRHSKPPSRKAKLGHNSFFFPNNVITLCDLVLSFMITVGSFRAEFLFN